MEKEKEKEKIKEELSKIFLEFCLKKGYTTCFIHVSKYNNKTQKFDTFIDSSAGIPYVKDIGDKFLRRGDERSNIFSCTKSIVGFYILLEYLTNGLPIDKSLYDPIFKGLSCVLPPNIEKLSHKSIATYLNHTSGIVTGTIKMNADGFGEAWNVYLMGKFVDSYEALRRGVWFDNVEWKDTRPCAFAYNNYGSQIGALLTEIYIRTVQGMKFQQRPFMLKDACLDTFFRNTNVKPEHWPAKDEGEAIGHSSGFSGLQLTGYNMVEFSHLLFTRFYAPLLFLTDANNKYVTHSGIVLENKFVVEDANDRNVDPGYSTNHRYRYCLGWWIPKVGVGVINNDSNNNNNNNNNNNEEEMKMKRKKGIADEPSFFHFKGKRAKVKKNYISAQGWFGQRICFNLENGMIAIRKTYESVLTIIEASAQETFEKLPNNKHPSFIWHFSAYEDVLYHLDSLYDDDYDYDTIKILQQDLISEFKEFLKDK
jgi:hypothetical protein